MNEVAKKSHGRHHGFYAGAATGVVVFLASLYPFAEQALTLGTIAFFVVYLAFSSWHLRKLTSHFLRTHAAESDAPVAAIFGVTIIVVAVSVYSLFMAINMHGQANGLHLAVAVVAVVLGWFTVHAMAAHHYAYEYYDVPDIDADTKSKGSVVGGLDFPSGPEPDGISFFYFSYVIGMTAQVADVSITSVHMQRLVVVHGIFSFFFNTVIIAATVNLAVSLGG